MLRFIQRADKAVVQAGDLVPGNWWGLSVLSPTFVIIGTKVHLYFRGPVGKNVRYHAVGCWTQPVERFDPFDMTKWEDRGIVVQPSDLGLTDPVQRLTDLNVIAFGSSYLLYFIVKDRRGRHRHHVMSSTDGLAFTDLGDCLDEKGAPFGGGGSGVLAIGSKIWFLHATPSRPGDRYVVRTSTDGRNFSKKTPAFSPTGGNEWNGFSFSTVRLVHEAPYVYAAAAASPTFRDWPEAVGLYRAHDSDPSHWTEYAANPIFLRSACGRQDEAAMWSFTLGDVNGARYAFYEGAGSRGAAGSAVSDGARDIAYYEYDVDVFSQVFCTVTDPKPYAEIWAEGDQLPAGNYRLQNLQTLGYLAPGGGVAAVATQLVTNAAAPAGAWAISRVDSFYALSWSSLAAEIRGASRDTGAAADINAPGTGAHDEQDWHLVPFADPRSGAGLYLIINRYSGMCLCVNASAKGDGALVTQRAYDGTPSQIWSVMKV